jgi:glycosyltransferase involved in cell wall biosynthesis
LPGVLAKVPDAKLLIVGDGDDRPRLEGIVKERGLGKSVTFTGYVSDERKVQLLQEMWFAVSTSSKEGWGLTVLEGNACGTPVIASDVPGLRDAVKHGETGILTPFGDIRALEGEMVGLLQDGVLRERLTKGALAWAAEFNWDTAAEKTIAVLEQVLRSTQASPPR